MLSSYTVIALVFTIIYNGSAFVFIIVLVIGTYGNVHLTRKTRFSAPHLFSASHCKTLCDFKLSIFLWLLRLEFWAHHEHFIVFLMLGVLQMFCTIFHFERIADIFTSLAVFNSTSSSERFVYQGKHSLQQNTKKQKKNLKHVMTCGYSHIVVDCTMGLSNAWIWTIVCIAVRI